MRTFTLGRDGRLLFATRFVRLFAYGFLSVVLVLYLSQAGLTDAQIGVLLTLTLVGDTAISLWITTHADRIGRKRMLIAGCVLMLAAGIVFICTRSFSVLLVAATVGVISPGGNEVGPFLAIEQASLAHIIPDKGRTSIFAYYNLFGSVATALGALAGGAAAQFLLAQGASAYDSYRAVILGYAAFGVVLAVMFLTLSPAVEVAVEPAPRQKRILGLHASRRIVVRLSALFSLDAFGGGLITQSIVAYWFHLKFGAEPGILGVVFFGANILAGVSALVASRLAARFGYINTMVFTHLPSNVLLILVPFMPTLPLAVGVLLLRFSISQMDVPARQAYTMAVVAPDERSGAAGVTGVARTAGSALSPSLSLPLFSIFLSGPFVIAGGLKILYDLMLFVSSRSTRTMGVTKESD